tara:strand:+ start:2854 stop:3198 length:345 start_codon:yes stop_codon:yes gene_type:complete
MPLRVPKLVVRALILALALVGMFVCVTGSTIAHTSGALAKVVEIDVHGHQHDEDASTLHGMSHKQGTADHTHDTPGFLGTNVWFWPTASLQATGARRSMVTLDVQVTLERPPRA